MNSTLNISKSAVEGLGKCEASMNSGEDVHQCKKERNKLYTIMTVETCYNLACYPTVTGMQCQWKTCYKRLLTMRFTRSLGADPQILWTVL